MPRYAYCYKERLPGQKKKNRPSATADKLYITKAKKGLAALIPATAISGTGLTIIKNMEEKRCNNLQSVLFQTCNELMFHT